MQQESRFFYPTEMHLAGGCIFAEAAATPSADARIFWRADWDPSVVLVEARPVSSGDAEAFDLQRFAAWATVLRLADGRELLLLSDGVRHLQLELIDGTLLAGPVRLHYALSGITQIDVKTLTLRRLVVLCRRGRFPTGLFPPEPRARRWALALQAYDGLTTGASHREIAMALFGDTTVREDWNGRSQYLRLRVRRLIQVATALVQGGYRDLLG
ncbi:DUF2285 domain-containing protein [Phaeospirillum tilakii]|uniref:DUF2285 domain-containing protein n=1 Tax=Phaeospirillum tilakii TaxID=741673 RepID=A0ABW5CGU8_9PROT